MKFNWRINIGKLKPLNNILWFMNKHNSNNELGKKLLSQTFAFNYIEIYYPNL